MWNSLNKFWQVSPSLYEDSYKSIYELANDNNNHQRGELFLRDFFTNQNQSPKKTDWEDGEKNSPFLG